MSKVLSLDLRKRLIDYMVAGHSCRSAAKKYDVSISTAIRLLCLYRATGDYRPRKIGGYRKSRIDGYRQDIIALLEARPDITLHELVRELADKGLTIGISTLSCYIIRLGYSYKKNGTGKRTGTGRYKKVSTRVAGKADADNGQTS